jgi:hypothetical protein
MEAETEHRRFGPASKLAEVQEHDQAEGDIPRGTSVDVHINEPSNLQSKSPSLTATYPSAYLSKKNSPNYLPHAFEEPFSPVHKEQDSFADHKAKGYGTEGEGSDVAVVEKIAEMKQITTANVDRWKRTFQAVRFMVKLKDIDRPDDGKSSPQSAYERTLKSQVTSIVQDEALDEDIFEEIANREVVRSWGVFYPDSLYKGIWDFSGLTFTVLQAIMIPFKLAFVPDLPAAWDNFEIFMDIYFMCDIRKCDMRIPLVVCLNTGFYREGAIVMTRGEIVFDYIKSWLLLDLLATFPYSWVLDGCIGDGCNTVESETKSRRARPHRATTTRLHSSFGC